MEASSPRTFVLGEAVTKTLTRSRLYIGMMMIRIRFFSNLTPLFDPPDIFDPTRGFDPTYRGFGPTGYSSYQRIDPAGDLILSGIRPSRTFYNLGLLIPPGHLTPYPRLLTLQGIPLILRII